MNKYVKIIEYTSTLVSGDEKACANITEDCKMPSSPQTITPEIHVEQRECMTQCL